MSAVYRALWKNKWLTADAVSIDDMIDIYRAVADELVAMKADGVLLDPESDIANDGATLLTDDAAVAEKYEFEPWDEEMDEEPV